MAAACLTACTLVMCKVYFKLVSHATVVRRKLLKKFCLVIAPLELNSCFISDFSSALFYLGIQGATGKGTAWWINHFC